MTLKNNELELLKEIELYLFNVNSKSMEIIDNTVVIKKDNIIDIDAMTLYNGLYNLIEKLEKNKEKTNIKNYDRIKKKRENDPNYARSKKRGVKK